MTKSDAIQMFGSTVTEMAKALGITRSAVSQWPDELRQEQVDRVIGAALRLGVLPMHDCSHLHDAVPPTSEKQAA